MVGPTTYTALPADYYISCDSSGGAITIKLPDTNTYNREFLIKDRTGASGTMGKNITITTVSGATTFDIADTFVLIDEPFGTYEGLYNSSNYEEI